MPNVKRKCNLPSRPRQIIPWDKLADGHIARLFLSHDRFCPVPRLNLSIIRFSHDTVWRDPHGTSWRATILCPQEETVRQQGAAKMQWKAHHY
jgi:hypothetical protein